MHMLLTGAATLLISLFALSHGPAAAHGAKADGHDKAQETKQETSQKSDGKPLQSTGSGTRLLTLDPAEIRMLVDETMLPDGNLEIGVLSLPVGYASSGGHQHGSTEVFYVIEGRLIHKLNGEQHILDPGMVGVVRPGDEIDHGVDGDVAVKALVVWAPGGEAQRLIDAGFTSTPLE